MYSRPAITSTALSRCVARLYPMLKRVFLPVLMWFHRIAIVTFFPFRWAYLRFAWIRWTTAKLYGGFLFFWMPFWNRWRQVVPQDPLHAGILLGLALAAVGHQLVLVEWYIEDAAISFAYAKHFAMGEGLVPYIGGERVEGYSNPLWVLLLAPFELVKINAFIAAKFLAAVFAACTIPIVYHIAKYALPDHNRHAPLIAPVVLAGSAQFAIWGASGLENSLFNVLLAMGILQIIREANTRRWPLSALCFFGLSITRPEGILYAAFAGFCFMIFSLLDRRSLGPTIKWLVLFFSPWTLYQVWHYQYFAYEFPNTYYAKMGRKTPKILTWSARGWNYVKNYSHELWQGYLIPVFIFALLGTRRWRALLGLGVCLILGFVLLYPHTDSLEALAFWPDLPAPTWWMDLRPWAIFITLGALPFFAIGRRGARVRILTWGLAAITLVYAVYVTGDWMKGYRWMSLLSVPTCILFAVGVTELSSVVQRWATILPDRHWTAPGWVTAGILSALILTPNIIHMVWFSQHRETGPFSVKKRVNHTTAIRKRAFMEGPTWNLDVDQGAHLYWSDYKMMDLAGLVDVSLAHHRFGRDFVREYVFREMKPEFAHVHGGWANSSRIPTHSEWKEQYFELPGYPSGRRSVHIGNHLRKDVIMKKQWPWDISRRVLFDGGVELVGLHIPAQDTSRGYRFYFEIGVRTTSREVDDNFRILLFLSNDQGELVSWDIAMGYDWLTPDKWDEDQIFHGKFAPEIPKRLPMGTYDVGIVVLSSEGRVLLPIEDDFIAEPLAPREIAYTQEEGARFFNGEVRFPGILNLTPRKTVLDQAQRDYTLALNAASDGACRKGEELWWKARMRHPRNVLWVEEREIQISQRLSNCWLSFAGDSPDATTLAALESAYQWNHRNPSYPAVAEPISNALFDDGLAFQEARNWDEAYIAFSKVLLIDKSRPKARRYAEEARSYRFNTDPESKALEEEKRKERKLRAVERRKRQMDRKSKDEDGTKPERQPSLRGEENQEVNSPPEKDLTETKEPPTDAPKASTLKPTPSNE